MEFKDQATVLDLPSFTQEQAVQIACCQQGWMNRTELAWLFDRAQSLTSISPKCVEVGSWKGRSMIAFVLGLKNGSSFCTVDPFSGNAGASCWEEAQLPGWVKSQWLCAQALLEKLRKGTCTFGLLETTSLDAVGQFSDRSLDFVFIDGAHDYENVRADIKAWKSKVKPGGMVAGHDSNHEGVRNALKLFPEVELIRETSIWCLNVK